MSDVKAAAHACAVALLETDNPGVIRSEVDAFLAGAAWQGEVDAGVLDRMALDELGRHASNLLSVAAHRIREGAKQDSLAARSHQVGGDDSGGRLAGDGMKEPSARAEKSPRPITDSNAVTECCSNCECGVSWTAHVPPTPKVCPECGAPALSNQEAAK